MAKAWSSKTLPRITEEAGVGEQGTRDSMTTPVVYFSHLRTPPKVFSLPKKQDQLVIRSPTHEPVEALHIQTTSFSFFGDTL